MSLEHSPARGGERCAFTISEFCSAHRISRSKFYLLKNKGLGPRITDVDGKQIITIEDAAAWRRERAEETAPCTVTAPAPFAASPAEPLPPVTGCESTSQANAT
jgi:hypothetical protein